MKKPFSPSCERNQAAILDVLKSVINTDDQCLLEIGSGSGQHAVFMAPHFPYLQWHTADVLENHEGINKWLDEVKHANVSSPVIYQSGQSEFPSVDADIVFTANTLHIMSWENVKTFIKQLGESLKIDAQLIIYGPFNYNGKFTSESNAQFDGMLKQKQSHSGIRDFEKVISLMGVSGIQLLKDINMPANNRILHFIKRVR